ncbi:hypothetical protein LTS18_007022 [Coniosporium uncinatum]|uniref:Uncharacterized protein n=1 Tax=Coniosporium uncinatum TaxID=93489 RepID=A0ACC3DAL6_9PEZI|nr:hypothetical protein LTS18_007022 [Coniosporium uncinatum]
MGWDTYNAYGLDYNETVLKVNSQLLVDLGFRDLGYNVIVLDDNMQLRQRDADGNLQENRKNFPSGLKKISNDFHAAGLKFGVYSSAGRYTCGQVAGGLDHEFADAQWWAGLGADYLKYDNCYNEGRSGTPKISYDRYAVMSKALRDTGRNITFSLCNWGDDKPWEWGGDIANSGRISGDIYDSFSRPAPQCPCGPDEYYCQLPGGGCSVMNILGKAANIAWKSQKGYWNDLDMLEVGNGGMTYVEYKTHFSMWAGVKSPLIMGNKLNELSPQDYAILINPAVLALSQDSDGSAMVRRRRQSVDDKDEYGFGEVQVWQGGLSGGDQAVAFLNGGNNTRTITSDLIEIFGGIPTEDKAAKTWRVYDLWGDATMMSNTEAGRILNGTLLPAQASRYFNRTEMSFEEAIDRNMTSVMGTYVNTVGAFGSISAEVPRHGTALFRLRPVKSQTRKRDEL